MSLLENKGNEKNIIYRLQPENDLSQQLNS